MTMTLLEFGANVDVLNDFGYSTLRMTIKNGNSQIAKELLKCEINLDTRDVDSNNALEYCLKKKEKAFEIYKMIAFHQSMHHFET